MSDNVYGPYVYKGCIITQDRTAPEFQKGLVFDRHASFFELHHQWYFICNDQSWPGTSAHYRDSVISYVHYRDNGEIDPVYLDRTGVGQYVAGQKIEAENYFDAEGVIQKECPAGGFELEVNQDGAFACYPHVMNVPANATISFQVAAGNSNGATIEVHQQSATGPLLGTGKIPPTGSWTTYKTISFPLKNAAGNQDLCLVFHGSSGPLFHLDWFNLR